MLGADRSLVHAGDLRGTARCADPGRGENIGKTHAFTGQAVEVIAITMAVYLTISLVISTFMNWYNAKMALVER